MKTDVRVRSFESRIALNDALTERLAWEIDQPRRGPVALMLAGGNTPLQAYQTLAGRTLAPSSMLELFFSDERYVPPTSDASTFRALRPLLEALALPTERILRVRTELPLERAAEDYERRLRALLRSSPRMPLGILGLGADGHTASLFTEQDLQRSLGKLAISVQRPDGRAAISVTAQLLANIAEIIFVVAGADKRAALKALIERKPESIAARAVAGCASIEIWADRDAYPPQPQPGPS
ncbi:MAG TPA: 6-phosphogluconolactonase, partial [Steroidobacteraceae bacterium]|nr:6-phosphogluconolactonase [Steroidobacteraceae bacterium]